MFDCSQESDMDNLRPRVNCVSEAMEWTRLAELLADLRGLLEQRRPSGTDASNMGEREPWHNR